MTFLEWSSINILISKNLAKNFSGAENNEEFRIAVEELINFIAEFNLEIQALDDDNTDLVIYNKVDRTGIYLKIDDRQFTSTVIFLTDQLKDLIEERFSKDMEEDRKMLETIMEQLDQGIISYDDIVNAVETFEEFHGYEIHVEYEDFHECDMHEDLESFEDFEDDGFMDEDFDDEGDDYFEEDEAYEDEEDYEFYEDDYDEQNLEDDDFFY